jgi:hypothetical protein
MCQNENVSGCAFKCVGQTKKVVDSLREEQKERYKDKEKEITNRQREEHREKG